MSSMGVHAKSSGWRQTWHRGSPGEPVPAYVPAETPVSMPAALALPDDQRPQLSANHVRDGHRVPRKGWCEGAPPPTHDHVGPHRTAARGGVLNVQSALLARVDSRPQGEQDDDGIPPASPCLGRHGQQSLLLVGGQAPRACARSRWRAARWRQIRLGGRVGGGR